MSVGLRSGLLAAAHAALALSVLCAACSDDARPAAGGNGGAGGPDASVSEASTADGPATDAQTDGATDPDAGAACSDLDAEGALIAETATPGARPSALGGLLFTGTYWLTERIAYNDQTPDSTFLKRSLRLDTPTATLEIAEGTAPTASGVPTITRSIGRYKITDGTIVSETVTCPGPGRVVNVAFTADGSTLTLFPGADRAEIYTLQ